MFEYDVRLLTELIEVSMYFEEIVRVFGFPKVVSNWVKGEVFRCVKEESVEFERLKV